MNRWTEFDKDWYALGFIEPCFVEEIIGWYDQEMLLDDPDLVAVFVNGSDMPVQFVKTRIVDIEPRPRQQVTLKWRWVEDLPLVEGTDTIAGHP